VFSGNDDTERDSLYSASKIKTSPFMSKARGLLATGCGNRTPYGSGSLTLFSQSALSRKVREPHPYGSGSLTP